MSFPLAEAVAVIGFCVMCYPWAKDVPVVMVLPLGAAMLYPEWAIDAAFTAFMVVMTLGTLYFIISAGADWGGSR